MYIKYERTDGGGERQVRTCQGPSTLVLLTYSMVVALVTLERHRVRVEDARSTLTSQICLRPSVLDRHPVPLRGVEGSNRSRVCVSSPTSLYYRYLEPVLGSVGRPCFFLPLDRGLYRTVSIHPPRRWA